MGAHARRAMDPSRDAPRIGRSRRSLPCGRYASPRAAPVALFLLLVAVAPLSVAPLEVDPSTMTPSERRSVMERAFPNVFGVNEGVDSNGDETQGGGTSGKNIHGVPQIPRGRLGALRDVDERDMAFEDWARRLPPAPYNDDDDELLTQDDAPIALKSVFGRGRGIVTTRAIKKGESLLELPLMKCLSTASARRSNIKDALSFISQSKNMDITIDAVLSLHLLHELYVQGSDSPWWPYVSILPKDTGSPLLWSGKQLAQLEGSNIVGFRDSVLKGWQEQRNLLFPVLTDKYPNLFPEQHFGVKKWTWAMSIVWSRAAHVQVEKFPNEFQTIKEKNTNTGGDIKPQTLLALVPLFDMVNHGYAQGDGSGSRPQQNDAPTISVTFQQWKGSIMVTNNDNLPGPNFEVRFNYGEKPSQYIFLQYGFVPQHNPSECVEVAPKVGSKDPLRKRKRALLKTHELSPSTRNFHFFRDRLDFDLLAATRISVMTEDELDNATAVALAIGGSTVNVRNEAVTRATLLKAAYSLLARYPTAVWEDLQIMESFFDNNPYHPTLGAEVTTESTKDVDKDVDNIAHSYVYRSALTLRVAEKKTLLGVARLLLSDLSNELANETCAERYSKQSEEKACLDRASGEAFDEFEVAPVDGEGGDGGDREVEYVEEKRGERDEL